MAKNFNKKTWIINVLRRSTLRYPPAIAARNRTKETYYIASKKGKQLKRVKYTCESCGKKDLKSSEVELDHTLPVVDTKTGFIDWNNYIERLYCDQDGYKLLCIGCHTTKTLVEDEERLKYNNIADIKKKRKKKK